MHPSTAKNMMRIRTEEATTVATRIGVSSLLSRKRRYGQQNFCKIGHLNNANQASKASVKGPFCIRFRKYGGQIQGRRQKNFQGGGGNKKDRKTALIYYICTMHENSALPPLPMPMVRSKLAVLMT